MTVWCVRTDDAGRFRYAKTRSEHDDCAAMVWTVAQWHDVDAAAAEQFLEPDDGQRALQLAFCEVAGLDRAPAIRAAIRGALNR